MWRIIFLVIDFIYSVNTESNIVLIKDRKDLFRLPQMKLSMLNHSYENSYICINCIINKPEFYNR